MRQIALPLDELRTGVSSSLIVTDSNAAVFAALANAAAWPSRCAILIGPARSGKSRMARYFAMQIGGAMIDDADKGSAETLFNAWNRAQETATPLLLLSRWRPADWAISLPDLRSRLAAATLLEIGAPDDELIEPLVQKHLSDRGAAISIDALSYVKRRVERSHAAIEAFARAANVLALAENAPVNLVLVKRVLSA